MSLSDIHRNLKKYYGLLTLICVITGFMFPQFSILSPYIPFLLAVLVFSMVIEHRISDFTGVVKHPEIVMALIISNLILYPFIGILLGHWLHLQPDIMIGLVLLCFAPSPVVAALWTELSGGNGTISISTALFSMILSIIVYPVILFFMGIASHDLSIAIFKLLALSIFAPAVIALFLRLEEEKHIPARNTITLLSSFIGLLIIVVAIAHMASKILANELYTIIIIVLIVTTLLSAGFIYGYFLKRFFGAQKDYGIGFLYTSSMRDGIIPLSVGITYFSSYSTIPATVLLIVMPFMVVGVYYMIRK
ncbi:MAG: hypothetical protein PQ963_10555 [Methanobacterium sp.]|jgi:BASS family bile acid:Na+ symporter